MKITCPTCETRYDVDEERFLPDGRSVRCAECDESWFVPAPDPIDDLAPRRGARASMRDDNRSRPDRRPRAPYTSRDDRDHDRHRTYDDDRFEDIADELYDERADDSRSARRQAYDDDHDGPREADRGGRRGPRADTEDALFSEPPARRFRIIGVKEIDEDDQDRDARYDDRDEDDDGSRAMPPRDEKGRFIKVRKSRARDDYDDDPDADRKDGGNKHRSASGSDTRSDKRGHDRNGGADDAHYSDTDDDDLFARPARSDGRDDRDGSRKTARGSHASDGDGRRYQSRYAQYDDDAADDDWRPDRRARLKRDAEGRGDADLRVTRSDRVVDVDFEDVDGPDRGDDRARRSKGRDAPRKGHNGRRGEVGADMYDDDPHAQVRDGASARGRSSDRFEAEFVDEFGEEVIDKGFGRRVREERRRSTALAPIDDLNPLAERVFDEQFLTAMRVQPKELERAIRKARRRAEARHKNRLTPMAALGWSALVGVIGAVAFVGYRFRDDIVAYYPKTAEAYQAVGIEANAYGLRIENVAHRVAISPDGPTIEITGSLNNLADGPVTPPLLQAEALGPRGELLSRWTFSADAEQIDRGASVAFSTRAPAPDDVAEVALSFAPAEGVRVSVDSLIKPVSQ